MYTQLVSRVVFPLQERLKRHTTVAVRESMERSQWWDIERLESLRDERLRALISHSAKHVPYFRDVLSSLPGGAGSIRVAADLQRLPMLTKSIIRAQGERMKSATASGLSRFNTGGSSGEPLVFFIGRERVSHDVAAKWRATRWWNVDIGDREIVVWGSPIELGSHDRIRAARDALMRTELLPAFDMSESRLDNFVARIRERRPRMLFGYPSAISLIAMHAEKRGARLDDAGVKVVFVTSERLYEHQRDAITRVFGCPVANGYGGRDAGFIAHQCPSGGMHITAEDIIVETVDPAGRATSPGVQGEIVVTHLATGDFPFIRYRTGDVGALAANACPCGRGLPLLERVEGRSTDFVVAADGTVMHGLSLIYIIRDMQGVEAFKVIQESRECTRVQLVTGATFEQRQISEIVAGFKRRLGDEVQIDVAIVDAIPPEKSGKFRYVVSHVSSAS